MNPKKRREQNWKSFVYLWTNGWIFAERIDIVCIVKWKSIEEFIHTRTLHKTQNQMQFKLKAYWTVTTVDPIWIAERYRAHFIQFNTPVVAVSDYIPWNSLTCIEHHSVHHVQCSPYLIYTYPVNVLMPQPHHSNPRPMEISKRFDGS